MIVQLAALLVLAASPPDSARWYMGPDVTERVMSALQTQPGIAVVRHTRARARDTGVENTFAVDTMAADPSWLMRFERLVHALPQTRVRALRLVPGQTYPYLYRVAAPETGGPLDVWVDFRGPVVLLRAGADTTSRLLRGREGEMVALLRQLDRSEPSLRQLASVFGATDAEGPEPAGAVAPAPAAPGAVSGMPPAPETAPAATDTAARVLPASVPVPITRVAPVYPDKAKRERIQGNVMVKVLVDERGHPSEVRVVRSVPDLDNAAVAAVARWTFRPAMKDGKPVSAWVVVPVEFRLR